MANLSIPVLQPNGQPARNPIVVARLADYAPNPSLISNGDAVPLLVTFALEQSLTGIFNVMLPGNDVITSNGTTSSTWILTAYWKEGCQSWTGKYYISGTTWDYSTAIPVVTPPFVPPQAVLSNVSGGQVLTIPTGQSLDVVGNFLVNGVVPGTGSGDTGPAGPQGPTGATGAQGEQGLTGPTGPSGANGSPGVAGATGPQGPAGADGPAGATGAQGPSGGATGATGESAYQLAVDAGFVGTEMQWLASLVGPIGPAGAAGATGPQGVSGTNGPTGAQGPIGLTGPTGNSGATGAQGPAGTNGTNGESAYQLALDAGFVGTEAAWLASLVGVAGPQGATGAVGATGPQGPIGVAGPAGPTGATGATGAAGPQGVAGPAGPQGIQGATGAVGNSAYLDAVAQGYSGTLDEWLASLVGAAGAAGAAGPQGIQGVPGTTGATGTQGIQGIQGPTGATGATGATGPEGPAPSGIPNLVLATNPNGSTTAPAALRALVIADIPAGLPYDASGAAAAAQAAAIAAIPAPLNIVVNEQLVATGDPLVFTCLHPPILGTMALYQNTGRLLWGASITGYVQFTVSGTNVTFAVAPNSGDVLIADYRY